MEESSTKVVHPLETWYYAWMPTHIGEVVLPAQPARLRNNDTQAYIRMDCERARRSSKLRDNNERKKNNLAHEGQTLDFETSNSKS